jgi:hypothetical protein
VAERQDIMTGTKKTGRAETLEQLEGDVWGEPKFNSYLVSTIHALRRKPILEFTVEDLRITLGQRLGMKFLTPLALDRLEADPFVEGHFYPGDLLVSVMALPHEYWAMHPIEAGRMAAIAALVAKNVEGGNDTDEINARIRELLARASWRA